MNVRFAFTTKHLSLMILYHEPEEIEEAELEYLPSTEGDLSIARSMDLDSEAYFGFAVNRG